MSMLLFKPVKGGGHQNSKFSLGQFNSTVSALGTNGNVHKATKKLAKKFGLEVSVSILWAGF
jgi:hypothetical protein